MTVMIVLGSILALFHINSEMIDPHCARAVNVQYKLA